MGVSAFLLISLFYAIVGIRVVGQIIRRRREIFDRRFTPEDRRAVGEAAFFILLPISVALHELGHAVAVWFFGGEVVDFGYYVFSGYVSHRGFYTETQQILIALAGSAVNVVLAALAVGAVWLIRPPMRAAVNELLIQFAVLSTLNALVLYPLLDFGAGLNADWSQIYSGGEPVLSAVILAGHVGILGVSFALARTPRFRRRLAALTGYPAGAERGWFGDNPVVGRRHAASPAPPEDLSPVARLIKEAGERAASGWPQPVQGTIQVGAGETRGTLTWHSSGGRRAVVLRAKPEGGLEIWGMAPAAGSDPGAAALQRRLRVWPETPDVDDVTIGTRIAMEDVERWGAGQPTQPVG